MVDARLCPDPATLSRSPPAPASTLVIFGAGGDLTKRLLMPALYNMTVAGFRNPVISGEEAHGGETVEDLDGPGLAADGELWCGCDC